MKKLIFSLFIVLLIGGCGIFGDDGSGMFGAWEKVSTDRGEYRGVENSDLRKTIQSTSSSTTFRDSLLSKVNQDTIVFDTLFISDDSEVNLSVEENKNTDSNHDALLTFEYFEVPHSSGGWAIEYVTDSTAFNIETNRFSISDGTIYTESRVIRNCNNSQAENEFLNITYFGQDTSEVTVFQIQVDGMTEIVDNINVTCRDYPNEST